MAHLFRIFNAKLQGLNKESEMEMEIRINPKYMNREKFLSTMERLTASDEYKKSEPEITKVSFLGDNLRIIEHVGGDGNNKKIAQSKINISNSDTDLYRISVNRETMEKLPSIPGKGMRKRDRITFTHNKLPISVMFTNINDGEKYEVEIEYNQSRKPMDSKIMDAMLKIAKEIAEFRPKIVEDIPKQDEDYTDAISMYNSLLDYRGNQRYPKFPITKPMDMTMFYLRWNLIKDYAITLKANGERMSLFMQSKNDIYVLMRKTMQRVKPLLITSNVAMKFPIILDGEYIQESNSFHIFDCLVWNKKFLIRDTTLPMRIAIIDQMMNGIPQFSINNGIPISISMKPYFQYSTVDEYRQVMGQIKNIMQTPGSVPYEIDGLIFQKSTIEQNFTEDSQLKWKPAEHQTIDFQIMNQKPYIGYKNSKNEIVPMISTDYLPQNRDAILTLENGDKLKPGQIVEFLFDHDKKTFVPTRVREDRNSPNFESQVFNGLELIFNPISWDTLSLQNLITTKVYQESEKDNAYKSSIKKKFKSILDINPDFTNGIPKYYDNLKDINIAILNSNQNSITQFDNNVTIYNETIFEHKNQHRYDMISMFGLLNTIPRQELEILFKKIDRLLNKDGILIMSFLDANIMQLEMPRSKYNGPQVQLEYQSPTNNQISISYNGITDTNYLVSENDIYNNISNFTIVRDRTLSREPFQSVDGEKLSRSTRLMILAKITERYTMDKYHIIEDTDFPTVVITSDSTSLIGVILSAIYKPYVANGASPSYRKEIRESVISELENRNQFEYDDSDAETYSKFFKIGIVFVDMSLVLPDQFRPTNDNGYSRMVWGNVTRKIFIGVDTYNNYYLLGRKEDDWIVTNFSPSEKLFIHGNAQF